MKTHPIRTLLTAALLLGSILSATAADQTATWNNSTGNWSDPTKWSTNPNFANNGNGGFTFDAAQSGGTLIVNQAITIEKFNFTGGTLTGSQTLTLNDLMTFTNGNILGAGGVLNANGGVTFSGATQKSIDGSGRVINLGGASTWSGGQIQLSDFVTLNNKVGGVLTTDFNGTIGDVNGVATFNNAGTFTKSGGTLTTTIAPDFNNTGTVNVNSGTLSMTGTGTHSGTLSVAGGTLLFTTETHNLNAGTSISGAGTVALTGGATLSVNAAVTSSASTAFNMSLGTLTGAATFTVNGPMTFSGGNVSGSGTLNTNAGVTFSGAGIKFINDSRVVNLNGSSTWTGGEIRLGGTSTLNNTVGGVFTTNFDGTMSDFSTLTTFNNAGTFTKSGGTGSTIISPDFFNTGTVNVTTGTLAIGNSGNQPYTQTGGVTALVNGAFIDPSVFNLNGGTLQGTGTIQSSVIAGPGSHTIAPGLSPGTLTINGNLTLSSGSTLAMELGGLTQGTLYDHLDVNGALTLAGMLDLDFINDFQNSLTNGEFLTLATADSAILGSFSNVASGGHLLTNFPFALQVWYGAGSPFGAENLVVVVPEPSRAMFLMLGLLGLMQRRSRPTVRETVAG